MLKSMQCNKQLIIIYCLAFAAVETASSSLSLKKEKNKKKKQKTPEVLQIGERERIQAAEDALARRRKVVAKLEAQANCQAQQQRAFARVSLHALPSLHNCILAESYSEATDQL